MLSSQIKKNCGFGEDALDYIYGEIAAARLAAFESHLVDCDACIGELAVISETKFEVYEWRKLAFEPLTTPVIEIPYDVPAAAHVSFAKRITVFAASISRVWAIAGLAAASVLVGLWLTFSAALPGREAVTVAGGAIGVSPAPEIPVMPPVSSVETRPETVATYRRRPRTSTERPAKVSVVREQPKSSRIQMAKVPIRKNADRNVSVPTLSGYSADEDSSLRLSEVFDDIGGM